METEFIGMQMAHSIMDNGVMIRKKAREFSIMRPEKNMRGTGNKAKNKEEEG